MKILVAQPGASMSTSDVAIGLMAGLRAGGHTVWEYALDSRIERSGAWLTYCWRKGNKSVPKPTPNDILYHAGCELVTRALRVQPDVVIVVSGMYLHPDVLVLMRRAGLKVAILFTESPYDDEQQARLLPWCQLAWTNERRSASPTVRYLPHAWNPEVHWPGAPSDDSVPAHDVVFVGTGFQERIDLLAAVDWTGIDFGLYGYWEMLRKNDPLRAHLRGGYVENGYASMLYRRAKVGLNLYRTSKGFGKDAPRIAPVQAESLNPRAYELAAAGCFTVSDARAEIPEVFGELVPTFSAADELRPLLERWLGDDEARRAACARLPGAVAAHTWQQRARQVTSDLQSVGIGARAANAVESRAS